MRPLEAEKSAYREYCFAGSVRPAAGQAGSSVLTADSMLHENCTQGHTVADGKALQVDVRCGVALVVLEDAGGHRGHIVAAIALHAAMPSGFQGQAGGQHVCGGSAAHLARDVQLASYILWELVVEREQEIQHVGGHHLLVVDAVARVGRIRKP